jgi:ABC-type phosphate transport system permease subunit
VGKRCAEYALLSVSFLFYCLQNLLTSHLPSLLLPLQQYQALDNKNLNDDFQSTSYYQMHAGYAFAAFAYILGSLLLIIGAIYISPLICGSANERMMLKAPSEIDSGYASNNRNEARTQI